MSKITRVFTTKPINRVSTVSIRMDLLKESACWVFFMYHIARITNVLGIKSDAAISLLLIDIPEKILYSAYNISTPQFPVSLSHIVIFRYI